MQAQSCLATEDCCSAHRVRLASVVEQPYGGALASSPPPVVGYLARYVVKEGVQAQ